jgi:hypothetical protein
VQADELVGLDRSHHGGAAYFDDDSSKATDRMTNYAPHPQKDHLEKVRFEFRFPIMQYK